MIKKETNPTNLVMDEPVVVSQNGIQWNNRHFADYKDGMVQTWDCGNTSFTSKIKTSWPMWKRPEDMPHFSSLQDKRLEPASRSMAADYDAKVYEEGVKNE
jgi:hypothetical protein